MPVGDRWRAHRYHLKAGSHHSSYLQRAWIKYGSSAFVFEIIEVCPDEDKVVREQYWMDNLNSCFNGRPAADSNLGYKYTDEQKARMSLAQQNNPLAGQHRVGFKESPEVTEARRFLIRKALQEKPLIWITDGEENMRYLASAPMPSGWSPGRTFSEQHHQAREAASSGPRSPEVRANIKAGHATTWDDPEKRAAMMAGRRPFGWWTDGSISKRVPIDEQAPEGWRPGRAIDPNVLIAARQPREKKEGLSRTEKATQPTIDKIDRRPDAARLMLSGGEAARRGKTAWNDGASKSALMASRADQCWITNGTETKRHSKSEPIPDGWRRGRGGLFGRAAAKAKTAGPTLAVASKVMDPSASEEG